MAQIPIDEAVLFSSIAHHRDAITSDASSEKYEFTNASGHIQELERNFSLISLAGAGLVVGNVWPALGGTILVAIFNGGPPGVLYEFIVVSIFYWVVAACVAELASAIPSSGSTYHWASITPGPKYGRVVGFYAGYWSFFGWIFGTASMSAIFGNICVQIYAVGHPDFVARSWHVFISYIAITWVACLTVCFFNKIMPYLNSAGIFFILAGVFTTIAVCVTMPGHRGMPDHSSSFFVWKEWSSCTGYTDSFTFLAGMLNGAYAVGTPDCVSHLAEEIPYPQINVPRAIGLQMIIGFATGLLYLIAILYSITDYDALFDSDFPIAAIYAQATNHSTAGTIGLLILLLFPTAICVAGFHITCGRTLWTLARDTATPFPCRIGTIHPSLGMPFNATITCGCIITLLGSVYVGSIAAFNALVGSFVLMSTASYTAALLPHLLTRRRNIVYGPFTLDSLSPSSLFSNAVKAKPSPSPSSSPHSPRKGITGFILNAIAVAYMLSFFVIFSFPFALPATTRSMNYAPFIWVGLTTLVTGWWLLGARKGYQGPQAVGLGGVVHGVEDVRKVGDIEVGHENAGVGNGKVTEEVIFEDEEVGEEGHDDEMEEEEDADSTPRQPRDFVR